MMSVSWLLRIVTVFLKKMQHKAPAAPDAVGGDMSRSVLPLDCGDGVTHSVPVYEGYAVKHGVFRLMAAGTDLTDRLVGLLEESGYSFTTRAEREIVRAMKEELCYVALDFEAEVERAARRPVEKPFELPDGTVINVGSQAFRAPEALFQPALFGDATAVCDGVADMVGRAAAACDASFRGELLASVVLSGGSTLLPGFAARMQKELVPIRAAAAAECQPPPGSAAAAVRGRKERVGSTGRHAAWEGGSILASLPVFAKRWISKAEYDEVGPTIVHSKCF